QTVDASGVLPAGLRGLLAILFLDARRGTSTGYLIGLACLGIWIAGVVAGAPLAVMLFTAVVVLPVGMLVAPVVGVVHGQRLPADYRQLDARLQFGLWLSGRRLRRWPLPAGALADPTIRCWADSILACADRIDPLARGARAALAVELGDALRDTADLAVAEARIDEAIDRVRRWEDAAAGLPPIGGKLYLRRDPLSRQAAVSRRAAAHLGVPSDRFNYFWPGQVLLLPPARSHRTLARLIAALLAAGVAGPGRPLPLQITIQGRLGDQAKLIALAQLLASGLDLGIVGPERRGDEGNLIARGRTAPERVAGTPERDRTDFLFSLIWTTVPDLAAVGYADQHERDLRVVQTLAAALIAAHRPAAERSDQDERLATAWDQFADGFARLGARWNAGDAIAARYLDVPFATVRPGLERLLAIKANEPDLAAAVRRLRDQALAAIEVVLAVARLAGDDWAGRVRLGWAGQTGERELGLAAGLDLTLAAIRSGARAAVVARDGPILRILLAEPAEEPAGGQRDDD
ncbi:MAG TPA: hypothetical protein VHL09_06190, partial [Dehalococcoidia bacterium]|nr:hypothetical protein [Dehalococcoidia bacterium]